MSLSMNKTKFILFVQGRSGSNLLRDLLNAHPDIQCDSELFKADPNHITAQKINKIILKIPASFVESRCRLSKQNVYGFVLMDYHLKNPGVLIKQLYQSGWKIIYVSRNDLMAQCFSNLLAQKTNHWHNRSNKLEATYKVKITKEELLDELNWWVARKKNEENILKGIKAYHVIYEDNLQDKADWPNTTHKLFEYLGVDPVPVSSTFQKTYSRHYSDIINNYDELMDSLKNTAYQHLIPDQFKAL